jgi:hypothetical protein
LNGTYAQPLKLVNRLKNKKKIDLSTDIDVRNSNNNKKYKINNYYLVRLHRIDT